MTAQHPRVVVQSRRQEETGTADGLMVSTRTQSHRVSRLFALFVTLMLLTAEAIATDGLFLQGNGAQQEAWVGGGIARPLDAHWLLLNPASITKLDRRVDVGVDVLKPTLHFAPAGLIGNPFAGTMTSTDLFPVPQFAVVLPSERFTLAFGLHGVSGTGIDYPHSRNIISSLFEGNTDRRLNFQDVRLSLVFAHSLKNAWTVGIGVSADIVRFRTDHLTLRLLPTEGRNEWDQSYGGGFSLGLHREGQRLSCGLAYNSPRWMDRLDDYPDLLRWPPDMPQVAQAGIGYRVTPRLEWVLDYKFIDWSGVTQLGRRPLQGGFGWRDQHVVKTGVRWQATDRLSLLAGYSLGSSPIDDEHTFINAMAPVIGTQHVGLGLAYDFSPSTSVHLSYVYGPKNTIVESGEGDLFSKLGKGSKLDAQLHSVSLNFGYEF